MHEHLLADEFGTMSHRSILRLPMKEKIIRIMLLVSSTVQTFCKVVMRNLYIVFC